MAVRNAATFVILATVLVAASAGLAPGHLARTYKLAVGRPSACPSVLRFQHKNRHLTVPAWLMIADRARCKGAGGKVLRSDRYMQSTGLRLPSLLRGYGARYFVGVESATRVCGNWAFNASSISYFVTSTKPFRDASTGIQITPDHLYLAYAHFATLCVYKSWLSKNERRQISVRSIQTRATPSAKGASAKKRACFPGKATVRTRSGISRIDALQEGDEVLAAHGVYSQVFTFSHRDPSARSSFVRVSAGSSKLDLSEGHLLYVNGALAPASRVRVGDSVRLADGSSAAVSSVSSVEGRGLYAPHTLHGDIVVDGIAASCYTTAVKPSAAHALLAPLRLPVIGTSVSYIADRMFDVMRMLPELPSA